MSFEVILPITEIDCFATGHAIRELARLKRIYGGKNWRKCKGFANLKLDNGLILLAEIHWYECQGIGKVEIKIKEFLE